MLVVLMNHSRGGELPVVSGRIWTASAIAVRRIKGGRGGNLKTRKLRFEAHRIYDPSLVAFELRLNSTKLPSNFL